MTLQKDILIKRLRTKPRIGQQLTLAQIKALLEEMLGDFARSVIPSDMREAYRDLSKNVTALTEVTNELGGALEGIYDSFGGAQYAAGLFRKAALDVTQQLVEVAKVTNFLEERNVKLSKALGINTIQIGKSSNALDKLAKKFNLGEEASRRYAINIENQFAGLGAIISDAAGEGSAYAEQLFLANQILVDQYELSEDAANNLINLGMQQGKTAAQTITELEATALAIEETTGNTGVFKEILQDISAISATNSTIFGKYPSQLGIATFTARRLGASFDDIANAARGALNIEQSIGAELEYQLLTGRKINSGNKNILQEFRKAYLTNDPVKMAQSYEQIFATQGDLIKNDINAANSLAAAMGISTEELLRQNRVYEARNQLEEQFKGDETVQELLGKKKLEIDDIATLQDKLQELKEQEAAGDQTASAQVTALQEFLGATKTQETSSELLTRSMDTLNVSINDLAKSLMGNKPTDLSYRKQTALNLASDEGKIFQGIKEAANVLKINRASLGDQSALDVAGNVILTKDIVMRMANTMGINISAISPTKVQDFILRPGQPPISMRKDDILIGGTDPFGERTNASRTKNTNMSADMIASAVTTALQAANLNVTVKLDPLALKTQAEFRSTRLNRTV